jgi:hypothetical protein
MALVGLGLGILISVDNFIILVFASFLRGAFFPMWAFIGATVGSIAPASSRARWISVVQTTTQAASILAPYVGGVLYDISPRVHTTPFFIAIAACLALTFLARIRPFRE